MALVVLSGMLASAYALPASAHNSSLHHVDCEDEDNTPSTHTLSALSLREDHTGHDLVHHNDAVSLSPAFSSTTYTYTATVDNHINYVRWSATAASGEICGAQGRISHSLKAGLGADGTTIKIGVASGEGHPVEARYYTINVKRRASADFSYRSFETSVTDHQLDGDDYGEGTCDTAANSGLVTLTGDEMRYDATQLRIYGRLNHADATIQVARTAKTASTATPTTAVTSSRGYFRHDVTIPAGTSDSTKGESRVWVQSVAQDGSTKGCIMLKVVRQAKDADATLSSIDSSSGTLSPSFSRLRFRYTLNVPYDDDQVTLTPTAHLTGRSFAFSPTDARATTGYQVDVPETGSKLVTITVTSKDSSNTELYYVNIVRSPPPDVTLGSLTVSPGSLTPAFASGNTGPYTVQVDHDVPTVTVQAQTTDSNATLSYNPTDAQPGTGGHQVNVAAGATQDVTITVTSPDGQITSDYRVRITRDSPGEVRPPGPVNPGPVGPIAQSPGSGGSGVGEGVVVLANGWSPADVGAAAALVARTADSALLYTDGEQLSDGVLELLDEYRPANIIIIGGIAAVDARTERSARRAVRGTNVERVSGRTRTHTAAEVARRALGDPAQSSSALTLVLANGWSPPDVAAAAALAARTRSSAVVYTEPDALSEESRALIAEYKPARVVIVGGVDAVSGAVADAIKAASPATAVERLAGVDRADTAAIAARRALGAPSSRATRTLVLANGWSAADTGTAAAYAARVRSSAVVYTRQDGLPEVTRALIAEYTPSRVVIVGGFAAVSQAVDGAIREASADTDIERLAGADRIATAERIARQTLPPPEF